MQLHFFMRFSTHWGQKFSIRGNIPQLGKGMRGMAVPMEYLDGNTWKLTLHLKSRQPFTLIYKYILQDEKEGNDTEEWGEDREITIDPDQFDTVRCMDYWNHSGDVGNAFLTAPFQEVLLKRNRAGSTGINKKVYTHLFRVKAPLLKEGEVLCMTGSNTALGNWNTKRPLLSGRDASPWWTAKISLKPTDFPLQYKYGIYNQETGKFLDFESGDNRLLEGPVPPKTLTVVSDGFARFTHRTWRGTGMSIPVFSIRTRDGFGTGEFHDIKLLADWAKQVGIKLLQILPVNDTTATLTWKDSYPYAAISAFALHPLYLHLPAVGKLDDQDPLQKQYLREQKTLNGLPETDYEAVLRYKLEYLKTLYLQQKARFLAEKDYLEFFEDNKYWLIPYAAFCYLRDKFKTADSSQWGKYSRYDAAMARHLVSPRQEHFDAIAVYYFMQYHLHRQLRDVVAYAHGQGIVLKGDIPIGIYRYSADAWVTPDQYFMDTQSGAPPDDFAVKGQNWGFPTYNWERMEEDGFAWWKKRFRQMAAYFDAFRIDHILGFFRIWQIPASAIEGILGHFYPAIPVSLEEFAARGIWFDYDRFCLPYITAPVLHDLFGPEAESVKEYFMIRLEGGRYRLKPEFATQALVAQYFQRREERTATFNGEIKAGLFMLLSNVLFFEEKGSGRKQFHPRYGMENTVSFQVLDRPAREKLRELYVDYFYRRQDDFWRRQAMRKLPAIKKATNMLICGEDLGMVPRAVPGVMKDLGILSLEIQRMPKNPATEFFHPKDAPYLSVVTPATHDMSTIRGWWMEDRDSTQRFYNTLLGRQGEAPGCCEPRVVKDIILQHLNSPAMWAIFQLQDLLGMSGELRRENPDDERINIPGIANYYWRYRMHIPLEDLIKDITFNGRLKECIRSSGRL